MVVITILLGIFIIISAFTTVMAILSFAPWVPSRSGDLSRILRLAQFKPGEKYYDLGCGDGRTVVYMADHAPIQAVGIEYSLPLYLFCVLRKILSKNSRIEFKNRNLFNYDFSDANVIFVFGMPNALKVRLSQKITQECKKGTRIISYAFPIPGLGSMIVDKPTDKDLSMYVYTLEPKQESTSHLDKIQNPFRQDKS